MNYYRLEIHSNGSVVAYERIAEGMMRDKVGQMAMYPYLFDGNVEKAVVFRYGEKEPIFTVTVEGKSNA